MKQTKTDNTHFAIVRCSVAVAVAGLLLSGCATGIGAPSGINLPGGGGISIPGGGSSGGGSSGGGSSGGGSSGGGSSGGGMGMPGGGSSGGGSSGGGAGMPGGGSSGGGSSGGGATGATMPGGDVQMPGGGLGTPGGGAAGEGCQDGGITGGGFGGGAGCDQSGGIGQFPGDPARAEELGEELDKSVGDFDEAIGEEQRQVSSVGRDTEGFGDGGSGGGGTIGLGEQAAGSSGGQGGAGGGAGAGGAAGSSESQTGPLDGMSDEQIASRTPDDIEVGSYDDIVARQLREAATAENDPVLRERLWDEYRKYKGLK